MSKNNALGLTEEEIEEEIINSDLIHSGGVDDQSVLQQMNLEEKKNLLHCIKQSKEDFHQETGSISRQLKKPIIIDTTSTEFPSLPPPSSSNKLKLQKRQSNNDSNNSQCISLLDDDEETFGMKPKMFILPFCVSDNAPPLVMPDRPLRVDECPYYQMRGESREEALRRMLTHHDSWKNKYIAETRKLEFRALENIQDTDEKELKEEENGDNSESDPSIFSEVTKTPSSFTPKNTKKTVDSVTLQSSRTPQRRTSRDSDCEEVQPVLKPDESKLGEWIAAAKPKNKRNRKQNSNREKAQSQPDVEFEFEETRSLWGQGRSGGPQSPAPAPNTSRRNFPSQRVSQVQEEEKVQCPICQQNFTRSTIENHAATCEGFSSSPMDVEEGS